MSFDAWTMTAPKWALRLLTGVGYAAVHVLTRAATGATWVEALISGVISGLFFGFLFGGWLALRMREQRESLGLADRSAQRAAVVAVSRGPVPPEPRVREAALRLARRRLVLAERNRGRGAVVTMVVLVLIVAVIAVRLSPWLWIAAVVLLAGWGWGFVQTSRLARREVLLRDSPDGRTAEAAE